MRLAFLDWPWDLAWQAQRRTYRPASRLSPRASSHTARVPALPGVLTAPLFGVPSKAEYYVFRAKYPPNTVNAPHHHPGDEELTVIAGTLYIGHGTTMDRDKATAYPPGSYIREPAGAVHFLLTKDEIVEVEVRGMGPRQNIYLK